MRRKRMIAFVLLLVMILVNIPFQGVAAEGSTGLATTITATAEANGDSGWKSIGKSNAQTYAVLKGTLTLPEEFAGADASGENKWPAISIKLTDNGERRYADTFQIIYYKAKGFDTTPQGYSIKIWGVEGNDPWNENWSKGGVLYDGVYIPQEKLVTSNKSNEKLHIDIPSRGEIQFQVIRLKNWAYFFMKPSNSGQYELVHWMYIKDNNTPYNDTHFQLRIDAFASGEKLTMSNYNVEYGQSAALNALNRSSLTLAQPTDDKGNLDLDNPWMNDAVYFPVDSENWTLEAKVTLKDYGSSERWDKSKENRAVYASPLGFNEGMALFRNGRADWYIQSLGDEAKWKATSITDTGIRGSLENNGVIWIRWMKSGRSMFAYVSTNGQKWTFADSRSLITEDFELKKHKGIYIDTQRGVSLTDITISTGNTCITQSMGETTQISSYPEATYAALSGTLKVKEYDSSQISENMWPHVGIQVVGNPDKGSNSFQIIYFKGVSDIGVKVPAYYNFGGTKDSDPQGTIDGVIIKKEQQKNDKLATIVAEGLDIKVVRMDNWAYLLANIEGTYQLMGRMAGLTGLTKFSLYNGDWNSGVTVTLENAEVTTGKKAALDAMSGIQFSVKNNTDTSNYICFPVGSNDWTLEAKVSVEAFANINNELDNQNQARAATVGPGSGTNGPSQAWNYGMSIHYYKNPGWRIQKVEGLEGDKWTGYEFPPEHVDGLNPENGGMWIRWVRYNNKLTVYSSANRVIWTKVHSREDLNNLDSSALGMYIRADKETKFTNVRITLDKGTPRFANLTLATDIGVNFLLELNPEVRDDNDAYVVFELPGDNHTSEIVYVRDVKGNPVQKVIKDANNKDATIDCYEFSCGIAAKEMASQIKLRIVSGHGNIEGTQYAYRVRKYGEDILNNVGAIYENKDKEMVKAMLNYGAYAQQHFAYNTGRLANAGMSEADKKLADFTIEDSYNRDVSSDKAIGLTYAGTSLMTTYQTKIRHYFLLDEGQNIAKFTFQYNNDSNSATETRSGKYYYVECPGILASKLGEMVTLTVTNTTNHSKMTITYSPYTNVKAITEDKNKKYTDASKNMMRALYWYGKKAKEYTTP